MEIRPRAIAVTPLENYRLLLTFDNHERKIFDVTPYIHGNWYGELQNQCESQGFRSNGRMDRIFARTAYITTAYQYEAGRNAAFFFYPLV